MIGIFGAIFGALPTIVDLLETVIPGRKKGPEKLETAQTIVGALLKRRGSDESQIAKLMSGITQIINGIVTVRNALNQDG